MKTAYAGQSSNSATWPIRGCPSHNVKAVPACFLVTALALLMGCAAGNWNPRHARTNTGYVDVYANLDPIATWEVEHFDVSVGEFRWVISESEPSTDGVLRLALGPGQHTLRLTCLNRVTTGPNEIAVKVENGRVTPVGVSFAEVGTAVVKDEPRVFGHYVPFREMRFEHEEPVYRLCATASASLPCLPKCRMPYASVLCEREFAH